MSYAQSNDPKLQLNGVWALRSLLYKADLASKRAVMKVLTYDALIELLHEPNLSIQEQALEIVRNLVCGGQEVRHQPLLRSRFALKNAIGYRRSY